MLAYPAAFKADRKAGGYVVTFRDIPEAITQGKDMADALSSAQDALWTAMQFYVDARRELPAPSSPKKGEQMVTLPKPKFGTLKGRVKIIDPHVFDPMTDEEVDAFIEGRY
jgi:predicted RNase H-like HicB family nuclease